MLRRSGFQPWAQKRTFCGAVFLWSNASPLPLISLFDISLGFLPRKLVRRSAILIVTHSGHLLWLTLVRTCVAAHTRLLAYED
jgi:hypothetical protein